MIEAVNSVISNAPLLRGNAEQVSSAQSFAADENQVHEVSQAPRAPFLSLVTLVDTDFDRAVYAFRDSDTGDVLRQFPTEQRLEALARQQTSAQASGARRASSELNASVSEVSSSINSSRPSPATFDVSSIDLEISQQTSSNSLAQSQAAAAAFASTAAAAEPPVVSVSISA